MELKGGKGGKVMRLMGGWGEEKWMGRGGSELGRNIRVGEREGTEEWVMMMMDWMVEIMAETA